MKAINSLLEGYKKVFILLRQIYSPLLNESLKLQFFGKRSTLKEKQTPNPDIFRCLIQLSKNV